MEPVEEVIAKLEMWRARYLAAHEVIAAVEHLFDVGTSYSPTIGSIVDTQALIDLRYQFDAWRKLVEAGVPTHWQVATAASGEGPGSGA